MAYFFRPGAGRALRRAFEASRGAGSGSGSGRRRGRPPRSRRGRRARARPRGSRRRGSPSCCRRGLLLWLPSRWWTVRRERFDSSNARPKATVPHTNDLTTCAPTAVLTSFHTDPDTPTKAGASPSPPIGSPTREEGPSQAPAGGLQRGEGVSQPPTGDTETPSERVSPMGTGLPQQGIDLIRLTEGPAATVDRSVPPRGSASCTLGRWLSHPRLARPPWEEGFRTHRMAVRARGGGDCTSAWGFAPPNGVTDTDRSGSLTFGSLFRTGLSAATAGSNPVSAWRTRYKSRPENSDVYIHVYIYLTHVRMGYG